MCRSKRAMPATHSSHILQKEHTLEVLAGDAAVSPRISLVSSWNENPVLYIKTPLYRNRLLALRLRNSAAPTGVPPAASYVRGLPACG